jgi:hypothetical protein
MTTEIDPLQHMESKKAIDLMNRGSNIYKKLNLKAVCTKDSYYCQATNKKFVG